jgi:hypothetical protein
MPRTARTSIQGAMGKGGHAALILPFAWIGLVGGCAVADAYKLGEGREDQCIRAGLVLATPVVAGVLGWLLGSVRSKAAARVAAFVFGTPLAGAINGVLVGLLLTLLGRDTIGASTAPVFGALIGGGHGLVFLPALAPGFVAYLRVGRARRESFVDRADRRTILVVTAGMGALIAWAFCSPTDEGLVRSAIIVAGLVVGFVGLVEDEIAYTKVSAALRTEGLERATGAPLLAGPSAHVLDFGLGYTRAEVVIPAHEAYRDAPRRAAVFLGDGLEAKNALKYAIVRDAVVASVSLLFALWR